MAHIRVRNKKINGKSSIVSGLRTIMLVIALLLLLSFFVSVFYIIDKEQSENITTAARTTLNSVSDSVLSDLERYKEMSRLVMMDKGFIGYLTVPASQLDPAFLFATRNSIMDVLNVTTMVDSVFAIRDDCSFISSNRDQYTVDIKLINNPEWRRPIEEKLGGAVILVNAGNAIFRTKGRPFVSIGRMVYDINSQKRIGMMFMNISSVFIDRKLSVTPDKNIVVMSSDGTYLAGDESIIPLFDSMEVSETVTHKKIKTTTGSVIFSARQITDTPIYIGIATPIVNGFVMYGTVYVLFGLMIVFLIAIVIAGTYITRNITKPLSDLTEALEENKEKGTLKQIDISMPHNEISILEDSYNGMVERVNDLFGKLLENEQAIRRAEMRMLHEQIKPHFLYNSLETIGYLAMEAGADEVHSALETLGSFYRNFLSKGDREITLRTELSIVKDYLALQKLRYGDILTDEYDIAEDTLECRIPKLILQPIVENSIYHGIRLKGEMGTIRISSRFENGMLHLSVYDTGIGMTQEQIDGILSKDRYNDSSDAAFADIYDTSDSFGLWGTIERVRGFCENKDVVNIRSELGEYTEVEFVIKPKR